MIDESQWLSSLPEHPSLLHRRMMRLSNLENRGRGESASQPSVYMAEFVACISTAMRLANQKWMRAVRGAWWCIARDIGGKGKAEYALSGSALPTEPGRARLLRCQAPAWIASGVRPLWLDPPPLSLAHFPIGSRSARRLERSERVLCVGHLPCCSKPASAARQRALQWGAMSLDPPRVCGVGVLWGSGVEQKLTCADRFWMARPAPDLSWLPSACACSARRVSDLSAARPALCAAQVRHTSSVAPQRPRRCARRRRRCRGIRAPHNIDALRVCSPVPVWLKRLPLVVSVASGTPPSACPGAVSVGDTGAGLPAGATAGSAARFPS